jgi:sulfonate transport system ATP-binding protein
VILMSGSPGRIREQFPIPLPRPRDINSAALSNHAAQITAALKGYMAGEVAEE